MPSLTINSHYKERLVRLRAEWEEERHRPVYWNEVIQILLDSFDKLQFLQAEINRLNSTIEEIAKKPIGLPAAPPLQVQSVPPPPFKPPPLTEREGGGPVTDNRRALMGEMHQLFQKDRSEWLQPVPKEDIVARMQARMEEPVPPIREDMKEALETLANLLS